MSTGRSITLPENTNEQIKPPPLSYLFFNLEAAGKGKLKTLHEEKRFPF